MLTLRIVAAATIRDTRTHMQIISDDGQWASTRAVHVVRLVSMADSRTERLHLQLTASKVVTVSLKHAVIGFSGLSKEMNTTQIVTAQKCAAKKNKNK